MLSRHISFGRHRSKSRRNVIWHYLQHVYEVSTSFVSSRFRQLYFILKQGCDMAHKANVFPVHLSFIPSSTSHSACLSRLPVCVSVCLVHPLSFMFTHTPFSIACWLLLSAMSECIDLCVPPVFRQPLPNTATSRQHATNCKLRMVGHSSPLQM